MKGTFTLARVAGRLSVIWERRVLRATAVLGTGAAVAVSLLGALGTFTSDAAAASSAKCGVQTVHTPPGDGAFNSLPAAVKGAYSNWPFPVNKSPWLTFKGKKGPWKLGLISFPLSGEWQESLLSDIKQQFAQAKKEGLVTGSLDVYFQPDAATATAAQQIQEVQTMVRQGINGIFMLPFNADAEASAIDAAGKAGVPVVLVDGPITDSKYGIYDWDNDHAPNYAAVMKAIGGKGNVLLNGGPAGETLSTTDLNDEKAAVAACPNAKVVGTIPGDWTDAAAKTNTAEWLASHPGVTVNAVLTNDSEATGVMQAFIDAGKTMPAVTFTTASAGMLSWWLQHPSYKTSGTIDDGNTFGYGGFEIMLRVLAGDGLKVNGIGIYPFIFNQTTFKKYAKSGKPLTDINEPPLPAASLTTNTYLNNFFVKPGTPS